MMPSEIDNNTIDNNMAMQELQKILLQKLWFAFDLDDTLHEFRKASKAASEMTLLQISTKYDVPMRKLKEAYSKVLNQKATRMFIDGKTADYYRRERLAAVLEECSIPVRQSYLKGLTGTYKTHLERSLELKVGAKELITYLKSLGKKILIVSEGPQDVQEWTLGTLGLKHMVDYVATTNSWGVSKVDGLLEKVLNRSGLKAKDVVYIGDNEERDIEPAKKCGVLAIQYSEKEKACLKHESLKINSLHQLESLMRG